MKTYTTSIISKFGDMENVKKDSVALRDILTRQGASLLIDVLADITGENANRWKLSEIERQRVVSSMVEELRNALNERL